MASIQTGAGRWTTCVLAWVCTGAEVVGVGLRRVESSVGEVSVGIAGGTGDVGLTGTPDPRTVGTTSWAEIVSSTSDGVGMFCCVDKEGVAVDPEEEEEADSGI